MIAVTWVNLCITSYYYLKISSVNYCSFWPGQGLMTEKSLHLQGHTPNVQFIVMFSYDMFSIIQYNMWYQFEMNKTEKRDFT